MTTNEETPQEDLEKKISEAELKAQEQNSAESEEGDVSYADVSDEGQESPPEKKELSRARKIWRRILIWLVVIAIAFAGGFFLDTTLRYQPAQNEIAALEGDLDDAQAEISSLESEIDRLGTFEEINNQLGAEIDQLNLHLVILSLRSSVADAALAIEQERQADAKLALDKVGSTLSYLETLLNPDQAEIVQSMLQRYELVMIELDNDGATVLTDLELLSSKLLTLENTLFSSP
jgi:cell division protein FtsL